MTIRYVYHASAQDDSDATWNSSTISYLTRQAAWTAWVSGDFIYVAHDHAESNAASQTYSSSATLADRLVEYRVNRTSGLYDISDATVNFIITGGGDFSHTSSMAIHGVRFSTGDDFRLFATANSQTLSDIQIEFTSASAIFHVGTSVSDNVVTLNGGNVNFSHATGGVIISVGGITTFNNVDFLGNALAAGLLRPPAVRAAKCIFNNCDITAYNSSTLVDMSVASNTTVEVVFMDCSLPSGYSVSDGVFSNDNQVVRLIACDIDGASNAKRYKNELHTFRGTAKDNITTYLDASPGHQDGDTQYSIEMTSGNNGTTVVKPWSPLEGIPLRVNITTTGSKTFTLEGVENFTSAANIDEIFFKLFYLGTADSTKREVATTQGHLLATALTTGTGLANWTGEPSGSRSVKLVKTVTVNEIGTYVIVPYLGKYEAGKVFHYSIQATIT